MLPQVLMCACTCLTGVAGTVSTGMAAEPGAMNWGPGAPATFFGALPPVPGVFMVNQTGYFSASRYNGSDGNRNPLFDLDQKGAASITRILGIWPGDLDGWRFASQVVLPFAYNNVDFENIPVSGEVDGFGNLGLVQTANYIVDNYHNIGVSLGYAAHTSSYSASRGVNLQNGYSTVDAAVHYDYFDPTGWDFGVLVGYHYNNRNAATDYLSGDLFSTDFKVTYAVTDKLKIGGFGGFLVQIEDDEAGSTKVSGKRYKGFNFGPSVSYNFGPAEVSLSYQFSIIAENSPKTNAVWLAVSMPLYVPKPKS
ncbi:transporter [Agrobacterium sp. fls2-241-TYG-188a]|uniref:SphA family protein n=1 Tax=Agrobacterium sp. fls2-241-TYG-188a TaxID=3040275 RepID=UPI0013AF7B25|nr:transporter [Agrobacterium sp. fls2-241-TYG-188a]